MKKKLKKIIGLITIIILVFEIYNFKSKKLYYVALGDSIAEGMNPYGEINYSYTDYIKDYLSKKHRLAYYTKQYAKSGDKSYDLIDKIKNNTNLKKDLREADVITISIGANDFLEEINFKELDITKLLNLKKVVKEKFIRIDKCFNEIRKYAKEKIIIVGYYNPIPFLFNTSGPDLDKIFAYIDSLYINISKKYDCKYVPVYQLFKKNSNYLPNPLDIHPNNKGYKAIADEVIKKM